MDGHQAFLRPAQHPFYVKKPLVLDNRQSNLIGNQGFLVNGKPSAHSVDLAWYNDGKPRTNYQFSEPYDQHSVSIREVFAKAILRGDVQLDSPEDETVHRNPSFITSSLPRQPTEPTHQLNRQQSTPLSPTVNIAISYKGSSDYFLDSSSESESESGGHRNHAYSHDDTSSRLSDEAYHQSSRDAEEPTHFHPLPSVLDISESAMSPRSTISGLFKPKYKDTTTRSNVHRNLKWDHHEVKESSRRLSQTPGVSLQSKLPRTPYPPDDAPVRRHLSMQHRPPSSPVTEMISHNKYLPSRINSSRRSPRLSCSPRKTSRSTSFLENETDLDEIRPATPDPPDSLSDIRIVGGTTPVEQMEMEDPQTWAKERQRARRKQRRKKCLIIVFSVILLLSGITLGTYFGVKYTPPTSGSSQSDTAGASNGTTMSWISTTQQTQQTINLAGEMRITSLNYTADHGNRNSAVFKNMSRDFCNAIGDVFKGDDTYKNCSVKSFSEGSLKSHYTIEFGLPQSPDSAEPPSLDDLVKGIQEEASNKIKEKVEANEFGPPDRAAGWIVDKTNLRLNAILPTTVHQGETTTTTSTPSAGSSQWSSSVTPGATIEIASLTTRWNPSTSTSTQTPSAILTTTKSMTDCSPYKRYPIPDDCTKYRVCSSSGKNWLGPRQCQRGKMFLAVPNRPGRGDCQSCIPESCARCAESTDSDDGGDDPGDENGPEDDRVGGASRHSQNNEVTVGQGQTAPITSQPQPTIGEFNTSPRPTTISTTRLLLYNLTTISTTNISSNNLTTTIRTRSTGSVSNTTSSEYSTTKSLVKNITNVPAHHLAWGLDTTTPSTAAAVSTLSSITDEAADLCATNADTHLVSFPDNCSKFLYCFNRTHYVLSDCPCEQMFDTDQHACVDCNFDSCFDCAVCP